MMEMFKNLICGMTNKVRTALLKIIGGVVVTVVGAWVCHIMFDKAEGVHKETTVYGCGLGRSEENAKVWLGRIA